MGQTLTHGVYLPDEGERNCYNGLAGNWSILDGAVGTIAEHTTQIAGKAPLVHTHTKSDITDLFNSANTWSGDNTYSASIKYKSSYTLGNLPASAIAQSAFRILDSTGTDFICDINSFQNTLATGLRFTTRNKMDANGFSPSGTIKSAYLHFLQNAENKGYLQWDGYTKNNVIPLTTNTYDLGSSSNQWNNLYAKKVNTQSVNGINPGALSLPTSSYVEIDTTNWDLTGADNLYIPSEDGYLICTSNTCTDVKVFDFTTRLGATSHSSTSKANYVYLPVHKNDNCIVGFVGTSPVARFYPCQGNV